MKRKLPKFFGIILIFVSIGMSIHANSANIINGCYKKNNGQLRIVENPNECLPSEVSISWYATIPLQLS
jgi:hypothetical protein